MRTANSIRNVSISFLGQIIAMLIAFPARFIFVNTLGTEYLGINGLFTNIVTLLSLAELGIGSAIIFSLYKPIANNEQHSIMALMNFYKKVYSIIGGVVFVLGLAIMPFIKTFVSEEIDIKNLYILFFLFVINASISYFYSYKRSIIIACQKNYIVNIIHYSFVFLLNIIQILVLLTTRNFILFLLMQILFTLLENILISKKANRMFPYLYNKNNNRINEKQKKSIFNNVRAVFLHKIGSVIVLGTDNIVISMYLGVYWVGIYSNYYLIINAINSILNQVFNSITASIGNLIVQECSEKQYQIFKNVFFMNFWVVGFSSISLWVLINPFISIWLGEEFILTNDVVFIIVLNFYIFSMRNSSLIFKNAAGLFRPDRYKPLIESLLNVFFSVLFVKTMGLKGVLLGTILSTILTSFWVEPYVIFKYIFKKGIRFYFVGYTYYLILLFLAGLVTYEFIYVLNIFGFGGRNILLKVVECLLIPNTFFFLIFRKTQEFKYFFALLKQFMRLGVKSS